MATGAGRGQSSLRLTPYADAADHVRPTFGEPEPGGAFSKV
jgi:hypothetical protein